MLKMSFVIEALEEEREANKTPDAASWSDCHVLFSATVTLNSHSKQPVSSPVIKRRKRGRHTEFKRETKQTKGWNQLLIQVWSQWSEGRERNEEAKVRGGVKNREEEEGPRDTLTVTSKLFSGFSLDHEEVKLTTETPILKDSREGWEEWRSSLCTKRISVWEKSMQKSKVPVEFESLCLFLLLLLFLLRPSPLFRLSVEPDSYGRGTSFLFSFGCWCFSWAPSSSCCLHRSIPGRLGMREKEVRVPSRERSAG